MGIQCLNSKFYKLPQLFIVKSIAVCYCLLLAVLCIVTGWNIHSHPHTMWYNQSQDSSHLLISSVCVSQQGRMCYYYYYHLFVLKIIRTVVQLYVSQSHISCPIITLLWRVVYTILLFNKSKDMVFIKYSPYFLHIYRLSPNEKSCTIYRMVTDRGLIYLGQTKPLSLSYETWTV